MDVDGFVPVHELHLLLSDRGAAKHGSVTTDQDRNRRSQSHPPGRFDDLRLQPLHQLGLAVGMVFVQASSLRRARPGGHAGPLPRRSATDVAFQPCRTRSNSTAGGQTLQVPPNTAPFPRSPAPAAPQAAAGFQLETTPGGRRPVFVPGAARPARRAARHRPCRTVRPPGCRRRKQRTPPWGKHARSRRRIPLRLQQLRH